MRTHEAPRCSRDMTADELIDVLLWIKTKHQEGKLNDKERKFLSVHEAMHFVMPYIRPDLT